MLICATDHNNPSYLFLKNNQMMPLRTIPEVCYRYLGAFQVFQETVIKEEKRKRVLQDRNVFVYNI